MGERSRIKGAPLLYSRENSDPFASQTFAIVLEICGRTARNFGRRRVKLGY